MLLVSVHVHSNNAFGEASKIQSHIAVVSDLVPNELVKCQLSTSDPSIYLLTAKWQVRYDHSKTFRFVPDKTGKYRIQACCDETICGILVMDPNHAIQAVGLEDEDRKYRRTVIADLTDGQEYLIAVGTAELNTTITIRLFVSHDIKLSMPIDPARATTVISLPYQHKGILSKDSERFEAKWADFYPMGDSFSSPQWIRVRVHSDDFDPVALALNDTDSVILASDDASRRTRDSSFILKPKQKPATVVVMAYNQKKLEGAGQAGSYILKAQSYPYDPSKSILGWIEHKFSNPLMNFSFGAVLAVIVSYFFFWRALRLKRICYEVLTDRLLVDDRDAENPLLRLQASEEALRCASHLRVKLWHAGHARIPANYVKRPLALVLENIDKVVHVGDEYLSGGWNKPVHSSASPKQIDLSFRVLDPGDKLIVSAICEQR